MSENLHIYTQGESGIKVVAGGKALTRTITVHNRGERMADVELLVQPTDNRSAPILKWAQFNMPNQSSLNESNQPSAIKIKGIKPKEIGEVQLNFRVPPQARDGFYSYEIRAYSEQYSSEEVRRTQQLQVLASSQESTLKNEPQISIEPKTSSDNPCELAVGDILTVEVTIENSSDRTDRFILSCPELDYSWFDIKYPEQQSSMTGVIRKVEGLELNPKDRGKITFDLHPPSHTFAGNYYPTLHVYSDNQRKLISLEIIYLSILIDDNLMIELNPEIRKIPSEEERFNVMLYNLGNINHYVELSINDLDKAFKYKVINDLSDDVTKKVITIFRGEKQQLTIIPSPRHVWDRIFRWKERSIVFQVELREPTPSIFDSTENLKGISELPEPKVLQPSLAKQEANFSQKIPQGKIIWKARRGWIIIFALAAFVTGIIAIWYFLFWQPIFDVQPKILSFEPSEDQFQENQDENIKLDWEIENPEKIHQLVIHSGNTFPDSGFCLSDKSENENFENSIPLECYNLNLADSIPLIDGCSIIPISEEKKDFLKPLFQLHSRIFKVPLPKKEILRCNDMAIRKLTQNNDEIRENFDREFIEEGEYSFSLRVLKEESSSVRRNRNREQDSLDSLENRQSRLNSSQVDDLTLAVDFIKKVQVVGPEPPKILDFSASTSEYRVSEQSNNNQLGAFDLKQNDITIDNQSPSNELQEDQDLKIDSQRFKVDGTRVQQSLSTDSVTIDGEAIAPIRLNWTVTNLRDIDEIRLVSAAPDGSENTQRLIYQDFSSTSNDPFIWIDPQLRPYCQPEDLQLVCESVPTTATKVGEYVFSLTVVPTRNAPEEDIIKNTSVISIKPLPPNIITFQVNGENVLAKPKFIYPVNSARVSFDIKLDWEVENADKVELMPAPGNISANSVLYSISAAPGAEVLTLKATNELGETVEQSVVIEKIEFTSASGNNSDENPSPLPLPPPPSFPTTSTSPANSSFPVYEAPPRPD